jgi:nitrous oxidase accessory protein NosD
LVPSNAIRVNAINVKLSGFTITSPGGISATGDGTEIISNIITIGRSPFRLNSFITVFRGCILSGSNLTIAKNTLTGDDWSLTGSNQNLEENAINGTISTEGNNCIIYDNNIIGDLIVQGSSNAITRNYYSMLHLKYGDSNTINGNSGELSLGNSDFSFSNNTVSGNIIKGSSPWGIWIGSGGRNNIFYENHIADKGYTPYETEVYSGSGIVFGDNSGVAVNNTFYHNVFINNTKNVKFNSDLVADGNFWDNGVEGNYWSDYNGTDADNDGLGDTPYIIDTEDSDGYPLATPLDIPAVFVPLPEYDPPLLSPEPSPSPTPTPTSTPTSALDSTQSSSIISPSPLQTIPELPSPKTAAILMATILMGALFYKNNNQEKCRIR